MPEHPIGTSRSPEEPGGSRRVHAQPGPNVPGVLISTVSLRGPMDLSGKLQVKPGDTLCVQNAPKAFRWDGLTDKDPGKADAVLFFAQRGHDLSKAQGFVDAAKEDRMAWVAYPKAGQLGTDLSREELAERFKAEGIQLVRMVSIDDVWSAARFRPTTAS